MAEGRALYLSFGCAACHGPEGRGDGPAAPSLHAPPRDLHDAASFKNGHTVPGIAGSIMNGVGDGSTGMMAFPHIAGKDRLKIAAFVASLASASPGANGSPPVLEVRDAWVREPAPGQTVGAGYFTIVNAGGKAIDLISASTPDASATELHEMRMQDDRMEMRPLDAIPIPAKGSVRLATGGLHLMLIDLKRRLKAGDTVVLTLGFRDGTSKRVEAKVINPDRAAASDAPPLIDPGDFTLVDQEGRPFRLSSLRGRVALLFFGYTRCPDACPAMMSKLSRAWQLLGPDGRDVSILFVSVDPRDTPALLKEYLSYFAVPAVGLTGSKEEVNKVVKQFAASVIATPGRSAAGTLYSHTTSLYVLGAGGGVERLVPADSPPQEIRAAVLAARRR
ncbi:MAG: SCO family protein [Acidobacteria bacterium]|nr:SCO family protein [Acidobacteriota bacterium]